MAFILGFSGPVGRMAGWWWSGPALWLLSVALCAGCANGTESQRDWQIVKVTGPTAMAGVSYLADGAGVVLEQDALVLTRRESRVRLQSKITLQEDGVARIALLGNGLAGRELRWEPINRHQARLVWPGEHGDTVMDLQKEPQ